MKIITTHDQADFDAIASLLAYHLLNDGSMPVLPNRLNRNVRAFLTLYGAELPYVEFKDLPNQPIELVTLVDSQSLPTFRGFSPQTQVNLIDHHPAKNAYPATWHVVLVPLGSTVTFLIEKIQESNIEISPIQATLLLLGIYEDTGSLTYSRTTSRDMIAAAFLLTQGANLSKVGEFLNHPFSMEQQALYLNLSKTIATHKINGHSVMIAMGDARQVDEELSTIVHKLRDTFEPDALIVLFETRAGVQLIARSNSDKIDVGAVAAHFHGGGHDRASAALIHQGDIHQLKTDLIDLLKQLVEPDLTVAQIMSHGFQGIAPDTPAAAASERMQRYGFEGYPVVDKGKVVGLLTRRSVDRALAHKLNLRASSLMNQGDFTIFPNQSIESLRQLMISTGWGQIPVEDPNDGSLIGIVTRTDLIHALDYSVNTRVASPNLADRLKRALPENRLILLKAIAKISTENHLRIYIVGGFVRDLILGRAGVDFDIVVEGDAISLAKDLVQRYGGRLSTHRRFGTAKWYLPYSLAVDVDQKTLIEQNATEPGTRTAVSAPDFPVFLDLITARTEFYTSPSALPTIESASIKLDLHRRDFTINTLAIRLDGFHFGELLDYWGGAKDLELGLVRVLHSLSFVDDPTRILRAIRFEQRFGFIIEERTLHLLKEAQDLISKLSGDRIRHELDHILREENAVDMLKRLNAVGVLTAIHPTIPWGAECERLIGLVQANPSIELQGINPIQFTQRAWLDLKVIVSYGLWFVRLSASEIQQIGQALHFPARDLDVILQAQELFSCIHFFVGQQPSQIAERLESVAPEAVVIVWFAADGSGGKNEIEKYVSTYQKIIPRFNGDDIRARGIPPGPVYRQILGKLRKALLNGEIQNAEHERAFFEGLISEVSK